jgi:hypothetical protein
VPRRPTALDDPAYVAFWRARHLCTVTLVRPDGTLHVTPMGIALDPGGGLAWGVTSRRSVKGRVLAGPGEHRVAACCVDGRWWASLEGVGSVTDDPTVVAEAEQRYAERYRTPRPNPDRVALRIRVAGFSGNLPEPDHGAGTVRA